MRISIITVCYNSAATIEDTIQSVINQTHPDKEYIIIDGGSKDGTLEIIKKYQDKINIFKSEPDEGIFDAMNKGIKLASGEVIAILNSDDYFSADDVLTKVNQALSNQDTDACYGDIAYIKGQDKNKIVRTWISGQCTNQKLKWGWAPPHPAFFVKKSVYDRFGWFKLKFDIAADYEFMVRTIIKNKIKILYDPSIRVIMRSGGNSASSLKKRIEGWRQIYISWVDNELKPSILLLPTRIILKIRQFI